MTPKAALFDFDGTIANTIPLVIDTYKTALSSFGITLGKEEIVRECMGFTEESICAKYAIEDVLGFKKLYLNISSDNTEKVLLFPDVLETFEKLQEKSICIGLITFGYRVSVIRMLDRLAIAQYFNSVVTFDDVIHPKPHPEGVFTACKTIQIEPSECIVIGDSKNDMFMGKGAGAKTAVFFPKEHEGVYNSDSLLGTNPDYIVHSWKEIQGLFAL